MSRHLGSRLARAVRRDIARERDVQRRGFRGTVLSASPLRVDLYGYDITLDAQDITVGRSVRTSGFEAGDVLVLLEVEDGDYVAVDVEESA